MARRARTAARAAAVRRRHRSQAKPGNPVTRFPKAKVTRQGYAAAFPGPEQMPFDRIREVAALRSAVVFEAQLGIKLGILRVNQQQRVKVNILRTNIR